MSRIAAAAWLASGALLLTACSPPSHQTASAMAGGDPRRGKAVIRQVGCGACHEIPGMASADGLVGPPLRRIGRHTVIAGVLANTPENLVRWIQTPQAVVPGNAMPDLGLSPRQARDVAAYLETLQ